MLITIVLLSFTFISNSGLNETFYKYLKKNSEFEIANIDWKNISTKRNMNFEDALEEVTIYDIIVLAEVIYSFYSGNIDVDGIEYLVERTVEIGLFDSLPKKYNFIEKKKLCIVSNILRDNVNHLQVMQLLFWLLIEDI